MSANQQHQKPLKMCKSPPKTICTKSSSTKTLPELGNYEVLNTNCTMVGSNNLNLDSKINSSLLYPNSQIKVCAKPIKSPDSQNLLKKPQSPRAEFLHNTMVQNVNKFINFNQLRSLQPSPTPNMSNSSTFASNQTSGFVQQAVRTTKSQQSTSFNNGVGMCATMSPSPSAYSNPSPSSYPNNAVSPYNVQISSPANSVSSITSGVVGMKSPVPSPQQSIRPPTPQPILSQAAFQQLPLSGQNLVQIIHAPPPSLPPHSVSTATFPAHQVLTHHRTIIAGGPPQQLSTTSSVVKIKPPQNILPKPPGGSSGNAGSNAGAPGGSGGGAAKTGAVGTSVQSVQGSSAAAAPHLVLPAGQPVPGPALLLNQVPLIVGSGQLQGSSGVQLILRPGTPGNTAPGAAGKLTATAAAGAPQVILQQGTTAATAGPHLILQQPGQRAPPQLHQPQQLVRVLTANGMLSSLNPLGSLNALTPTYIMQQPPAAVQSVPQATLQPSHSQVQSVTQSQHSQQHTQQSTTVKTQPISCLPQSGAGNLQHQIIQQGQATQSGTIQSVEEQLPPPKKKPKKKKKNKEPKLDLANIMKLSGIGDEDDVLFESDASESAISEPNPINIQTQKLSKTPDTLQAQQQTETVTITSEFPKRIGNIHISALNQDTGITSKQPTTSNRTESVLAEKQTFGQSQISVQQSLSDINAINQNLTQIGLINQNQTNFLTGSNQILSQISTSQHNSTNISENQNLASILQALNQGQNLQNFSLLNGSTLQNITSVSQQSYPTAQPTLPTSNYQKFPTVLPTNSNLISSISQNLTNSDALLTGLSKSQSNATFSQPTQKQTSSVANPIVQNITNAHFNIPNAIPNIQVQNFCGNNSNLILNQLNQGNILAPNIPNFSGNITINNSLIPNANLTLPSNIVPNFLPANIVQTSQDINAGFANNMQRTGGFKLALSEDGRLILQHDPTLNQDIQSQLLLQSIFGINLQGGNLVLTSVSNTISHPPPPKPQTISELPKNSSQPDLTITKTTNIIQNSIPSVKTETQPQQQQQISIQSSQNLRPEPTNQTGVNNPPNNYSYIVNLTPDQLETLKRNGQLTVNGQTIFMHRPNVNNKDSNDKTKTLKGKSPKKNPKQFNFDNKNSKSALQEHLNIKNQNLSDNITSNQINKVSTSVQSLQTSMTNQTIINSLQSPVNKNIQNISNQQIIISSQITSATSTASKQTLMDSIYPQNSQNIICIQQNYKNNQNHQQHKISDTPLMSPKESIIKQTTNGEQLIILQQQNVDSKNEAKSNAEMIFPNNTSQNHNGIDTNPVNVEQFLTNLNINPTNLGQLISQKLSQELPSGVDPKILNISPGPGHIVTKIDISSDNMQQILNRPGGAENPPTTVVGNSDRGNLVLPPLISMGVKQESQDVFDGGSGQDTPQSQQSQSLQITATPPQPQSQNHQPPQNQLQGQLPALIIGNSMVGNGGDIPATSLPQLTSGPQGVQGTPVIQGTQDQGKVYQRVHTIQLTPQKQQLLKSVQLQIHALSARLQQKPSDGSNPSDQQEIHTALRHLFLEQQKILATGKVIPNITSINNISTGTMETLVTTPVSSSGVVITTPSSKTNNGTFLTSLLQQPVVSHNQTQKVYYHHGNQIIAINPQWSTSSTLSVPTSVGCITTTTTSITPLLPSLVSSIPQPVVSTTSVSIKQNKKSSSPNQTIQTNNMKSSQNLLPGQLYQGNQQVLMDVQSAKERSTQTGMGKISGLQIQSVEPQKVGTGPSVTLTPTKRIIKQTYSKAQLIEQQLQTDQNGAMNPEITTPFSSKADAVKRLVRYHCYNQPILSQKDLAKADEIFELTARHFIDKFRFMVNKYQSLLLKESMREVQTSELMMIDRMFLAEEQQSFLKLQSDYKLQNELELLEPPSGPMSEPPSLVTESTESEFKSPQQHFIKTELSDPISERFEDDNTSNTDLNIKCGLNYFSDESCDSNNFHPEFDEFIGLSSDKKEDKTKHMQNDCYRAKNSIESYNTTKIIGNFEIEINNKSCNSQNYRQKIEKNENFNQKDEDYDEWLCIQRELGYFPENKIENDQKVSESSSDHSNIHVSSPDLKSGKIENDMYKKSAHKRTSSESNRLETLKKYRVEKHNSKVKKTGSIIGEVKFEVRIEHKKVFPEQKQMKTESQNDCVLKQMPMKRTQCFDYSSKNIETNDIFNSKRACLPQKQMPTDLTSSYIKQEEFPEDNNEANDDGETFDRSIDEQVQSAIDSILNLQQITSMAEKNDGQSDGNKTLLCKKDDLFSGSNPGDTLDEAVNSILS